MKVSVKINRPVTTVAALFINQSQLHQWKKGFVSYTPISGTPGQNGAVTKLVYKGYVLIETILLNNLPAQLDEQYEREQGGKVMMTHVTTNRFTPLDANATMLEADMQITNVVGFLPRLMVKLFAGAGKKMAQQQLNAFKALAERL